MITALGLALRAYRLSQQSLWIDEVLTANAAAHSLRDLVLEPAVDANFPPLHNMVVHLVGRWFGTTDALLRAPSVIAGALSIPALYAAGRPWAGARVGLLSAFLLAISPFHLWYSQEARPYAFLVLFWLLAVWCAARFLESPGSTRWLAAYILAAAAAFYCHIIAGPAVFVLTAYLLAAAGPGKRGKVLAGSIALGLLLLPQVIRFMSVPPSLSANEGYRASLSHLGYTLWAFGTGYSLGPNLLELRQGLRGVVPYLPIVLPALVLLCVLATLGAWRLWGNHRRGFWFLMGWSILPIAFAMLGAIVTVHPYNVRYAILAAPAFLVLCAAGLVAVGRSRVGVLAALVLVLVQLTSLVNYYSMPKYAREDSRAGARFLNTHAGHGELVLASAPYVVLPLRHYGLRRDLALVPYPRRGVVRTGDVPRDLDGLMEGRPRVWVFLSRTFHSDPGGEIVRYLDSRLTRAREFEASGVRILLYSESAEDLQPAGAADGRQP